MKKIEVIFMSVCVTQGFQNCSSRGEQAERSWMSQFLRNGNWESIKMEHSLQKLRKKGTGQHVKWKKEIKKRTFKQKGYAGSMYRWNKSSLEKMPLQMMRKVTSGTWWCLKRKTRMQRRNGIVNSESKIKEENRTNGDTGENHGWAVESNSLTSI